MRTAGKSYRIIGAHFGISPRTAAYHADPYRKPSTLGIAGMHASLAKKFYWWTKRTHPEWMTCFVNTLPVNLND